MAALNSVFVCRSASWLAAARAAIVFILLCGGLYPLLVTTVGSLLFPHQATGSLIVVDDTVVGSELVGQLFKAPEYFHGRPSAVDYDPFSVGGSNYAASNPALRDRVAEDSQTIALRYGVESSSIPVDLLAASGSGIDPHISPESAQLQAERVATARGITVSQVNELIVDFTEGPTIGVFGQPRVNVLRINLALDGKEASD
ncbi:potassium-transporting ATPase subunit KdpC [Ectothiorhodospira marina]|uniref:Potassium-transporting ATPase KdpC subunit n=1 Tax=Ectothiorhodospira marina TaxID=1396821 RepID=A0A1H7FSX4_9GAMM|nr:potassium-transporting ATPase subunit KdpC [Ectothiorhodospira marina]SEK29078.1 K+-transporting ATPase ATPase C chain [Ectothiorhodospira marina]